MTSKDLQVAMDSPVVKSNELVWAFTRLTLREKRFLALALAKMEPRGEELPLVEMHASEYAEVFGAPIESAYEELKGLVSVLQKKTVEFQDGDEDVSATWIPTSRYLARTGRVRLRFNADLKKHLLNLKEKFTTYRIRDVYQFKSNISWSVYELLRKHKSMKKLQISLKDFKASINCADYPRFFDFNKRVLAPALHEINTTTDLLVEYDKKFEKKTITGLVFYLAENPHTKTKTEQVRELARKGLGPVKLKNPAWAEMLTKDFGIAVNQATELAKLWEGHELQGEKILSRVKNDWLKGKVKRSLGGYAFKTLRDEGKQLHLPCM